MTAQGTARNGAGEVPKAEFAAEKAVTAAPEGKAPVEVDGEDVGGPFVIVNGDSDGLSDRGSDLDKAPDEDSPSEEDDAPSSNAAPDAPVGGDHGATVEEAGASAAADDIPSTDGIDRAAEEPKGGADDDKGERRPDLDTAEAEVVQQETAGEELGGADAKLASGSYHAVTGADSDAPAVDSEVNAKEVAKEDSAATDVSELVTDEAATDVSELVTDEAATDVSELVADEAATDVPELVADEAATDVSEQNADNAALDSCEHGDTPAKAESGSAAAKSAGYVDDNREEESPTTEVESMEQSIGGPGAHVASADHCSDSKVAHDSYEVAAEAQSHADESKSEKDLTEVGLVEQSDVCGEQDGMDANGTVEKESDQQEEGDTITEAEVERDTEAVNTDSTGIVEELIEEGNHVDGRSSAKLGSDASGEQQAVFEKVESEATSGTFQVEKMGNDNKRGFCDEFTADVASNEEVKLPAVDEMNEVVPGVAEMVIAAGDTRQEIVQGDGLVKDGDTDPSVGTSKENDIQVEIAQVDETTAESDFKGDSMAELNTEAPLLSQKNFDSVVETVATEQSEAPNVDQPNEIQHDVAEAKVIPEVDTEVSDGVSLQAAADSSDSTSHNEPQPTELVDGSNIKDSTPLGTELESCDHAHIKENKLREISGTTVDLLVPGASLEHESTVVGQAELSSVTYESEEKPSDSAVNQGEPVTLNADKRVVVDDAEPSSATGYEPAVIDEVGDISKKDDSSNTAVDSKFHENQSETCNAATTCDVAEDITSESLSACTKSSDLVQTKCLEEDKVDDKHAHGEEAKVVEETSELRGDLDKNNMGDAQFIRQQKIYIIKVPRFAGEDIWEKQQVAHSHLDKLTQERDKINSRKQEQKSVCEQYREKLEAARQEEREARAAHGDKKNDLNSVRSVIGKLNQANSIEEIDDMIATKERTMQHETISLKQEKLLLREITDLKAQRKQLCSNMGSKAEINEAFDQKDHIHERHKTLKKDSDVLFTNLKSLEENTKKIQKSLENERMVLRKINDEYRVANERRQKAYSDWAELKAEPFKKNKYFFTYKDDKRIAGDLVSSGNMHQLQLYCNNQVERVMEMWNKDDNFRNQYVEANKVITLKRFGTPDGRRLGPDEEPPVIPNRRPSNPSPSLAVSSPNVPTTSTLPVPGPVPVPVSVKEDSFPVLPSADISKRAKSKASTSAQNEKITVTLSERDVKETEKEKALLMEEELERAKKAEELARMEEKLREEKAAAEKERLRLEQKAKAKEAEERKRRKAEKAQERAEFKARKEAEMKEKKKAKKDKKKGPAESSANGEGNATALATADTDSNASDNPREADVPQPAAPKRISRPAAAIKQLNRLQPMPAPLRNRGKRKMRQYILIAAAVLSVLALFVAGNYIPRLKSLHS